MATGALTTIDPSAASIVRGLVPLFGIGALGIGPRVFMFRKRAVPAVGKIKDRHVEHEHRVVSARASCKNPTQGALEIVFAFFGFHFDFRCPNANAPSACHHVAVAGFWSASFEGGRKSGGECERLLNCGQR